MRGACLANPIRPTLVLAAFTCLLCVGCLGEAIENKGEDDAFLRVETGSLPTVEYSASQNLFPVRAGDWWDYQVQTAKQGDNGTQTASDPPYRERLVVGGPANVDGREGVRFDTIRRGKRVRSETYAHGPDGLYLLGAGTTETVSMTPPLPILTYPAVEGADTAWDGLLTFAQSNAPGNSHSRMSSQETVKTPAGSFETRRVDTVIDTNLNGQRIIQIESRWLCPGVGVVRQESRVGAALTVRTLIGYRGSKTKAKRVQSSPTPKPSGTPIAFPLGGN